LLDRFVGDAQHCNGLNIADNHGQATSNPLLCMWSECASRDSSTSFGALPRM
jgi:hypothetical protein